MNGHPPGLWPLTLVALLVTSPAGGQELDASYDVAIDRTRMMVEARAAAPGEGAALVAAFDRLRDAGVLHELLEIFVAGEVDAESSMGSPIDDPEVFDRVYEALERHYLAAGKLSAGGDGDRIIEFDVLRASEERPGWFHVEATVVPAEGDPPEGLVYDCFLVSPGSGEIEAEACG